LIGPRAGFQELALTHLDSMYSYARVLARNESDADDLLQDSLLRAFRGFDSFKSHLSFKVWVFKIIKNAQIDRIRRRRARPIEEEGLDDDGAHRDSAKEVLLYPVPLNPEEILLRRVSIEAVREAIRRLPSVLREVVELREIEELSYQEIAGILDRPVGTVMSRLYRGRNLVRSFLQEPSAMELKSRSVYGL
jgi:RNA polymerase sigma-70 factor, ECF subfamily